MSIFYQCPVFWIFHDRWIQVQLRRAKIHCQPHLHHIGKIPGTFLSGVYQLSHRLNLVALKWQLISFLIHHHKSGKGHRKVIAQSSLGNGPNQDIGIPLIYCFIIGIFQIIAIVEYLKKQLISLISILAKGAYPVPPIAGSFNGQKPYFAKYFFNDTKDVISSVLPRRVKISGSLGWAGFAIQF